jgi:methylated-DNA-[protein]-cysteine S-methyltransferase
MGEKKDRKGRARREAMGTGKPSKPAVTDKGKEPGASRRLPCVSGPASLIFSSRWGWMGVAETAKGIAMIVLPKASRAAVKSDLRAGRDEPREAAGSAGLRAARKQLNEYLAGTRTAFDLPLDFSQGTAFQRRVWRTLQRVPYGALRPYQWVADLVGGRRYARAVGNAVGANPLPIVIPCHRIIARDGSLGGFSGGLPTKRKLLALEGSLSQLRRHGRHR